MAMARIYSHRILASEQTLTRTMPTILGEIIRSWKNPDRLVIVSRVPIVTFAGASCFCSSELLSPVSPSSQSLRPALRPMVVSGDPNGVARFLMLGDGGRDDLLMPSVQPLTDSPVQLFLPRLDPDPPATSKGPDPLKWSFISSRPGMCPSLAWERSTLRCAGAIQDVKLKSRAA